MLDTRNSSVKTIRRAAIAVVSTLVTSSGAGCSIQLEDPEAVSAARQSIDIDHVSSLVVRRSPSILGVVESRALDSQNALPSGALADGPLRSQLVLLASVRLRSSSGSTRLATLATLPNGPTLIRYVARCALAESDPPLQVRVGGSVVAYPGRLGLARAWAENPGLPLDTKGQRWLTACLMAHTNNLGPVDIATSGPHEVLTSPSTAPSSGEVWTFEEAGYYGNLFLPNGPAMFACSGAGAQASCTDSGISDDLQRRICGRQPERCGFTFSGPCNQIPPRTAPRDACSLTMPYASCGSAGVVPVAEVITVSLRTKDAPSLHPWCAQSAPSCTHGTCSVGGPLAATCGGRVCVDDEYCCKRAWDSACVAQARAAGLCGL